MGNKIKKISRHFLEEDYNLQSISSLDHWHNSHLQRQQQRKDLSVQKILSSYWISKDIKGRTNTFLTMELIMESSLIPQLKYTLLNTCKGPKIKPLKGHKLPCLCSYFTGDLYSPILCFFPHKMNIFLWTKSIP